MSERELGPDSDILPFLPWPSSVYIVQGLRLQGWLSQQTLPLLRGQEAIRGEQPVIIGEHPVGVFVMAWHAAWNE